MSTVTAEALALFKVASPQLKGKLYLSASGFLLLSIPNAIGRGMFSALNVPGLELPTDYGPYNAHCTIMTPEEVASVGASNIKERGRDFAFQLGAIREIIPAASSGYSKVWAASVRSAELAKLRRSYGLSSQPVANTRPFHVTIGVRKKHVLNENSTSKTVRTPRKASIASLSNLVGNEGTVHTKAAFMLQELRREGHQGMPGVVAKLFDVSGRHGRTDSRTDARPDRHGRRLYAGELSLGDADGASSEQTKQSYDHGVRADQTAGGVVRRIQHQVHECDKQTGQPGLDCGGRDSNACEKSACGALGADLPREDANTGSLGTGAWDIRHNNPSAAAMRVDCGGGAGASTTAGQPIRQASNNENEKQAATVTLAQTVAHAARKAIEPKSEAQADAGNYQKGHVNCHGLRISIETKKGQRRNPAWPPMAAHYGYIRRTEGKDGDHVDVFLGPDPKSEFVAVVDQINPTTKVFDEHKVIMGVTTLAEARKLYNDSYTPGWKGLGKITPITMHQFKEWLKDGSQNRPLASQMFKMKKAAADDKEESEDEPGIMIIQRTTTVRMVAPEQPRDADGKFEGKKDLVKRMENEFERLLEKFDLTEESKE